MSVVIDEVVTEVATPPREQTQQQAPPAQSNVAAKKREWEQSQARYWQRQQRITAD